MVSRPAVIFDPYRFVCVSLFFAGQIGLGAPGRKVLSSTDLILKSITAALPLNASHEQPPGIVCKSLGVQFPAIFLHTNNLSSMLHVTLT